ncbi:hypothetical protein DIPPA_61406 [Diplonema papillatum]|nr:hypothetical protein DIPPA_61406 [Diplonema papillatum]
MVSMGVEHNDQQPIESYARMANLDAKLFEEKPEGCRYPPVQPAQYAPWQPGYAMESQPAEMTENPNLQRALFPCILFTALVAFLGIVVSWVAFMLMSEHDNGKRVGGTASSVLMGVSFAILILFIVGTVALCFLFRHGTPVDWQRCRWVSIAMLVVTLLQIFLLPVLRAKNQSKEDEWDREHDGDELFGNSYGWIYSIACIWTAVMTVICCCTWGVAFCCVGNMRKQTVAPTAGNVPVVV